MDESQPKISKHLAKMRDMGFVKDVRQEQFIYYGLNISDQLYNDILQRIVDDIESYPVINKDIKRSKDTRGLLESCKI